MREMNLQSGSFSSPEATLLLVRITTSGRATILKYKGINRILLIRFHCAVCIYWACLKWLLPEYLIFQPLLEERGMKTLGKRLNLGY